MLETALALVAEHGVAGASLRELARRLGMSQPSLYHYFSSKEELVERIVEYCADRMLVPVGELSVPARAEELPRFAVQQVLAMWASERHPRFVRVLFAIALETPELRPMIRRVMQERLSPAFDVFARHYLPDEASARDLAQLLRMVTYALAFPLLEERAILGEASPSEAVRDYAEWVAAAGERLATVLLPPTGRGG